MHPSTTYLLLAALLSVGINVLALPMGAPSVGLQNRNYDPTLEVRTGGNYDLATADIPFRSHMKTTDASQRPTGTSQKITPVGKAVNAVKGATNKVKEAVKGKNKRDVLTLPLEARTGGNYDLATADIPFRSHMKTTDASKKIIPADASKKISPVAKAGIAAKQVVHKVKDAAHAVHDKIVKRDLEFEARDLEFENRSSSDNDLA
ncbi:hypothetical protein B0H34DRAFT_805081 [Crassisporium funariophilum]|nr:hypothetical protein B0H34DRAFT_805081 [Crassisporium funariophilum]